MIGHRRIDAICLGALALAVGIVLVFSQGERLGIQPAMPRPAMSPASSTTGGSTRSTCR